MKILIPGATGSIGRHLLPLALGRRHEITVLVRNPATLSESVDASASNPRVLKGDVLDVLAVDGAVRGQDAVIYSIGVPHSKPTTLFSASTRILIAAMMRHGVRRLIAITGIGAGDSRGHGGFLYDHIIFPLFTRRRYADKNLEEALIRESSLEWIIVRPAVFADGSARGPLRVAVDLKGVTLRSVLRADVAAFTLDQLTDNTHLRKMPLIGF